MAKRYKKGTKPCTHPINKRQYCEESGRVVCARCGKRVIK